MACDATVTSCLHASKDLFFRNRSKNDRSLNIWQFSMLQPNLHYYTYNAYKCIYKNKNICLFFLAVLLVLQSLNFGNRIQNILLSRTCLY